MDTSINFKLETLKKLQCPPAAKKQFLVSDTRVRGLQLRITTNGKKQYAWRRRLPHDNESPKKVREITIGKFEDLSIEQARERAEYFNTIVGQKKDPSLKAEAELTYLQLFEKYIEDYAKLHTVTWEETVKNHKRYFTQWDKQVISKIKREHVQSWINKLGKTNGKHTANRQYNTFRAVITWGLSTGLIVGQNPSIGVKVFKTAARERFILPSEFESFAKALNTEEPTIRDFFWICLFTGARCSNVLSMEWSQVNMELKQWRIPITKNGDSQTIPLTVNAIEILEQRKADPDRHEQWVFQSTRKGRKTGAIGHLVATRHAFGRIVARAELTDLRIHDLRRTAGSYMAIEGISSTIIGKALGHKSQQATAVYSRLTQDPVRQALEKAHQALTKPYDWCQEVCKELDALRDASHKFAHKDAIIPPDSKFEDAKEVFRDVRKSGSISKMPTPHVWLGPLGEIGITWKAPTFRLEVVQTNEATATVYFQDSPSLIQLKDLPTVMAKFAETAAPPPSDTSVA